MRRKGICLLLAVLLVWALAAVPAWAVTDYEFLRAQKWKAPQPEPVELGTLRIQIAPLMPGTHQALFSLPRDFEVRLPAAGSVAALEDKAVQLELKPVGARDFTGLIRTDTAVSEATFLVPLTATIPQKHTGDIELRVRTSQGQLPDATLVAGAAVPGELAVATTTVGAFKDGAAKVTMEFRENMADLLWAGTPVQLTLPAGLAWTEARGTLTAGAGFRATVATDGPVLEIRPERQSTERATFRVEATLRVVDAEQVEPGAVWATVEGLRDMTASRLLVAQLKAPEPVPEPKPQDERTVAFTVGTAVYTVDGATYQMDAAPYLKNGRTLLPLRFIGLSLGVAAEDIAWDGRTATLTKGDTVIKVAAGAKSMRVDGTTHVLDTAPEMAPPGRIMLPYRAVAEAFGAQVEWDAATQTVFMTL